MSALAANISPPPPATPWTPLTMLASRLAANLAALATHNPSLAQRVRECSPSVDYFLRVIDGGVVLGTRPTGAASDALIQPLPTVLSAAAASGLAQRIFPDGACGQAVVIAGEDTGWLWNILYGAPCNVPTMPKYRPPLFFLIHDIDRLRAILHVQEWTTLLADRRVRLFAGVDAFEQFRRSLVEEASVPWPRTLVSVGTQTWPPQVIIDQVLLDASNERKDRMARLERDWATSHRLCGDASDAGTIIARLAARFGGDRPLKVLGVTSRYTTFLQHSMRDWLAAFERLGHDTRLLIESADHEVPSPLVLPSACVEFEPDLVVCIDHCRSTLKQVPADVPVVMWVQDRLPHIFCAEAGAAQSRWDFCLGFGRLRLSQQFGYSAERFLPTPSGVNERRFAAAAASPSTSEQADFGCDVSYVSHASTPADVLMSRRLKDTTALAAKYLGAVYDQLRAHYDGGGAVLADVQLRALMNSIAADCRVEVDAEQFEPLLDFFRQEVANALFRHRALNWAAEAGVDLRLYGRGWDQHPTLARFARGEASNVEQLGAIYRASKINLQVTPFGAVHPRLLDGVAAGAFFLIRHSPGDVVGLPHRELWEWCQRHGVSGDAAIRAAAQIHPALAAIVDTIDRNEGYADHPRDLGLYDVCCGHADVDFMVSADSVWGEDYHAVAFDNRAQLHSKLSHYLADPDARQQTAESMRDAVIDRVSYTAISRRLLKLMATQLASSGRPMRLAA